MAILKFRIYFEEDESVYRDVAIRHTQTFFDLHETILKAYEFDNKHKALFSAAMIIGSGDGRSVLKNMIRNIKRCPFD